MALRSLGPSFCSAGAVGVSGASPSAKWLSLRLSHTNEPTNEFRSYVSVTCGFRRNTPCPTAGAEQQSACSHPRRTTIAPEEQPNSATDLGISNRSQAPGMGSRGSAGGHNLKRSGVVEDAWSLDARELQRRDILEHGWCARVALSHRSGRTSMIEFECEYDRIHLRCGVRDTAGHLISKSVSMEITRVSKRYGGSQAYLLCPRCEKRVLLVYLNGGDLVCRTCADLVHTSSRERTGDRALRRCHKLRARLGDDHRFLAGMPARPPHMRWRTYHTTWRKISAAEQALARAWLPSMRAL